MEACRPILKRINVRSVERSGYILAHECSSPDSSEIKNKLFIIEKEMTKRFRENEYRRDCYVESFTNEVIVVFVLIRSSIDSTFQVDFCDLFVISSLQLIHLLLTVTKHGFVVLCSIKYDLNLTYA